MNAAVVGAGPAGLIAAETLALAGIAVTVYDRMPSAGRKLLMAGRGGLNLTHSEPFGRFVTRYGRADPALRGALEAFPPEALRAWADGLGQETVVGSSGRVFPRAWKASPLLRAWLTRLERLGVRFAFRHRWTGFDGAGGLAFATPDGERLVVRPAATVLALGGASWPRLGADGAWTVPMAAAGIEVAALRPANAGLAVPWSDIFRQRFEGAPLNRVALSFGSERSAGEAVVTAAGLEGGAVYGIFPAIRDGLAFGEPALLEVDLRPDWPVERLAGALSAGRGKQTVSAQLRKAAGLPPVAIGLLREAAGRDLPGAPEALAALIKAAAIPVSGTAGLDRAISTAGGVRFEALDGALMLQESPGTFVAGEMLDWEAPTGGYLLQACFATGVAAAQGALAWLSRERTDRPIREARAGP